MSRISLYDGDCLEILKTIPDNSIDFCVFDPPFGQTPLNWDKILPVDKVWQELNRVCKQTAPIVIFGQEPFSSQVRISNLKDYKYDWYWEKERLTNVFQVKRRPGKVIETLSVFYRKQPTYNPQRTEHIGKSVTNKVGADVRFSTTMGGKQAKVKPQEYKDDGTRHPLQLLKINRDNIRKSIHPTQKPVALGEYLVKTYTNEGDSVLDITMGSGFIPRACRNLKRNCIGIDNGKCDKEKSEYYGMSWKHIVTDLLHKDNDAEEDKETK